MSKKRQSKASAVLDQQLATYIEMAGGMPVRKGTDAKVWLAFGAATSAALLGGTAVEAAIIHTVVNTTIGPAETTSSAIINMGGGSDFRLFANSGFVGQGAAGIVAPYTSYFGPQGAIATTTGPGYKIQARKFSSGELIGTPGSSLGRFSTQAYMHYGSTSSGFQVNAGFTSSTGFLGVQTVAGNFGWIQVHVVAQSNNGVQTGQPESATIIDYAYDDTGAHLTAGQTSAVPEPSTTMLLGLGAIAMGAAGVRRLRRRKKEAATRSPGTATATG